MFVRPTLAGGFAFDEDTTFTLTDNWAALAPELLWPIWGITLGAATLAYHYRAPGHVSHVRTRVAASPESDSRRR